MKNKLLVIKMTELHECLHEEQIQEQSIAISKLDAEMTYKKEKLEDLKEDNRRMESKIDDIKKDINALMIKSKSDDDKLDNRLTAIETRLDTQEKATKDNRDNTNLKIGIVGVILVVIQIAINFH